MTITKGEYSPPFSQYDVKSHVWIRVRLAVSEAVLGHGTLFCDHMEINAASGMLTTFILNNLHNYEDQEPELVAAALQTFQHHWAQTHSLLQTLVACGMLIGGE